MSSQTSSEARDGVTPTLASERSWHGLWCMLRLVPPHRLDHKPCQERSGWSSAKREAHQEALEKARMTRPLLRLDEGPENILKLCIGALK